MQRSQYSSQGGSSQKEAPISWVLVSIFAIMMLGNNPFKKLIFIIALAYLGIKTFHALPQISRSLTYNPWLTGLQIWGVLSISWSVVRGVTIEHVFVQSTFFMLCVLLAANSAKKNVMKSLKISCYVILGLIILFSAVFPGQAYTSQGLRSFYVHKNALGMVLGICILVVFYSGKSTWREYGVIALAFLLLGLTKSKTPILIVVGVIVVTLAIQKMRGLFQNTSRFKKSIIIATSNAFFYLLYAVLIACVIFREAIAGYIIRVLPYEFLTGRGELWVAVLRRAEIDLLRGIGPGSFWGAGRLSEIAQTSILIKHPYWIERLGSADGGYIDLIASLGFVGVVLLLASLITLYKKLIFKDIGTVNNLVLALTTYFVLHNVTETTVYHSTNPVWFLYLFLSFHFLYLENPGEKDSQKSTGIPEIHASTR